MEGSPALATDGLRAVEESILRRVTERAEQWFPDAGVAPRVRLHKLAERPRAVLYGVHVGSGPAPRALAKVRRDWPDSARPAARGARPRLTPDFLPAPEQTALEYRALSAIAGMVGTAEATFGAVRPLDHLVGENTVLMEYVDARTLRDLIVRGSRFSPRGARRLPRDVWQHSGAWLRRFQEHMPGDGLPARQPRRDDVIAQFHAYGEFLARRLGARAAGDAARRGAELAAEALPEELPLAVGHGDYAPRNVFLLADGRLAVFDPLPRWRVPRFDDLCRFLVSVRLHGLTLLTQGWSDGARELDRRERRLIEGYAGGEHLPMAQLRCYQLLITLDKWSTLADGAAGGGLRGAPAALGSRYVRAETRRLLDLAAAAAS